MPIRLFLTDLDGTLLPEGGNKVDPAYFDVIDRLFDRGILFGVSTGRQIANIQRMFWPIKDKMVIVGENGACVLYKGEEIFCGPMKEEDVKGLVRDTRLLPGCLSFFDTRHMTYVESRDMFYMIRDQFGYDVQLVDDLMQVKEPCLKYTLYRDRQIEEVTSREFVPAWEKKVNVAGGGSRYLDIVAAGSDKGSSVKRIQDLLGIPPKETLAIGDNINDLGTLSRAAFSFAVGNAREEVKEACSYLAPDNMHDGVLRVMEDLIENTGRDNLFNDFHKQQNLKIGLP